jgi:hypothetical protein
MAPIDRTSEDLKSRLAGLFAKVEEVRGFL